MSDPTVTRAPDPPPDGPAPDAGTQPRHGTPGQTLLDGDQPPGPAPEAPPGYELSTLVGSGGMGAVYRAHDLSLSRDVALKFLHAHYAPDSVAAWRFTEEARITARLQHHGVPPIHQVGRAPDGRPFLAMKLIKGQTLEAQLKARASPADERGRFIGIFEKVCDAVAFAHSRRIIHRDLKPANVMVGNFGEVQVMDWGLAKELGEAPSADTRNTDATLSVELRAGRAGADTTQAGSLLGTPAYMPPEQAVGAIDQIDKRADVFGLGAILCVILTGRPPFVADSAEAARVLAARGKLDDCLARLDACGAEPELVALAKRCLSPEATDRPKDAGEVAGAVSAFRADAEHRARQAEMDRARAEVRAAEERKRRRVLLALAVAVLGLFAVAGYTLRRIDNEQTRRRHERQAEEERQEATRLQHEADVRARQLTTERDVGAALNEVQVLREEGWKQADDTHRWGLTLTAARSALKRAEGLLAAGEPTAGLRARVAAAAAELARDDRDRALIVELDRISDENDIRFLIPVTFSRRPSERYAAAFRAHGIDLEHAPREEAVAWLKAHRFRARLTSAVRNWQFALPTIEIPALFNPEADPETGPPAALAAVGGGAGLAAVASQPKLRDRLRLLADAVTDDPFAREWWAAVNANDHPALKRLVARGELGRLSSGELSVLAEGLGDLGASDPQLMEDFLRLAYERFPDEFWVNIRLGDLAQSLRRDQGEEAARAVMLRHISAAVAARPRSVAARISLAAVLWEQKKGDPTALRIARGAAELDPASAWPRLFLGFMALEVGNWADVRTEFESAVRADPDTTFLMASAIIPAEFRFRSAPEPTDEEVSRIIEALIAVRPDHPGGYDLRAGFRYARYDYRGALADYRAAKARPRPEYLRGALFQSSLDNLEKLAKWEEKLPAVLRGEFRPTAPEYSDLAAYCAGFEQKFALAARFAGESLAADPKLVEAPATVAQFAGWAVRAGSGKGTDAADLPADEQARLRRQALAWLNECRAKRKDDFRWVSYQLWTNRDLAPVREPADRAKLPPEERAAWEQFWKDVPNPFPLEPAPPPREVKR